MKKTIILCSILATILLLCIVVYNSFTLVKTSNRSYGDYALTKEMKEQIKAESCGMDFKEIVKYSRNKTCEYLRFTEKNAVSEGKANCVGYAMLCSGICNYALKVNSISGKAKPVVGYIAFWGINLCDVAQSVAPKPYKNFVKDHDFIEVQDDDTHLFIDASLYDLGLNCTTKIDHDE